MDVRNPVCESVWIKEGSRLIDAESYEKAYRSAGGGTRRCGYYVAWWPDGTSNPSFFDPALIFIGPYVSRHEAEIASETMCSDPTSRVGDPAPELI